MTDCSESVMKKGFTAFKMERGKNIKETFKEMMRASECAFDRIKEAFDLVAKDEAEKMSIVQEIMRKSTDYLRRQVKPWDGDHFITLPEEMGCGCAKLKRGCTA